MLRLPVSQLCARGAGLIQSSDRPPGIRLRTNSCRTCTDTGFDGAAPQRLPPAKTAELDRAFRHSSQSRSHAEGEIIDVFSAAGLKQPDISILSDQFLAEVRWLKYKNVAAELLAKLLGDEIRVRSKRNVVQSREFSEMLKKTLNAYHNRAIATQEVIEELIKLAKEMSAATQRGVASTHG